MIFGRNTVVYGRLADEAPLEPLFAGETVDEVALEVFIHQAVSIS
jgi:hypothetical protein